MAYKEPVIFWNTANLIVDSGGVQTPEVDEDNILVVDDEIDTEEENEEDYDDDEEWEIENKTIVENDTVKKKKKVKTVNYGKVAAAIGKFSNYGIKVSPPNINDSSFTFTPKPKENLILYGLRGITRIGNNVIDMIIANRPYASMADFLNKVKINKVQMINLIKSGAFDEIEGIPRQQIMQNYLNSIVDKKQRLTLQNMQMLINKELIPDEMSFYAKLFLFNKFLKTQKQNENYLLNDAAINFIEKNFTLDIVENGLKVNQKVWDKLYSKTIEPMRQYLKEHATELLLKLNGVLYDEVVDKYGKGTISRWEMDSVSFYSHEHELQAAAKDYDDFFKLSPQPEIEYSFETKNGQTVNMYKMHHIIGTVIDKNKMRNTITLLTPTGVVNVRIYKNQYAIYDKQISERGEDGVKHVIEPSWFKRGTLLMVQGIRRDDDFIPKKNKNSYYPIISKITEITNDGKLKFQYERMEAAI